MPFGQAIFVDCNPCSPGQQRKRTWPRHARLPLKESYHESERGVSLWPSATRKKFHFRSKHDAGCTLSPCTQPIDGRVKLANEVTFKRMRDTMEKFKGTPTGELSLLAQILLGQARPSQVHDLIDVKFIDETLNDSQKQAVRFCLSVPDIALIHGPPGVLSQSHHHLRLDGKNIHPHRNHKTTDLRTPTNLPPRRRPLKHLRRQPLRTPRPARHPARPSRPSSPTPPLHPLPLPRRPNPLLRSRRPPPRRKRRRGQNPRPDLQNQIREGTT